MWHFACLLQLLVADLCSWGSALPYKSAIAPAGLHGFSSGQIGLTAVRRSRHTQQHSTALHKTRYMLDESTWAVSKFMFETSPNSSVQIQLKAWPAVKIRKSIIGFDCLPDPIQSFQTSMFLMLVCAMAVIGTGFACLAAAGSPQLTQERKGAPSVPPMPVLDLVRVLVIGDIILLHFHRERSILMDHGQSLFVQSGFVLFLSSSRKVQQFDLASGASFWARRLARLCPCYYIVLILSAIITPSGATIAYPLAGLMMQSMAPVFLCDSTGSFTRYLPWAVSGMGHGWFASAILMLGMAFPCLYNLMVKCCSSCGSVVCMAISLLVLHWGVQSLYTTNWSPLISPTFAPYMLLDFMWGMLAAQYTNLAPRSFLVHKVWRAILPFTFILALDGRALHWIGSHAPWWDASRPAAALGWSVVYVASRCVAEKSTEYDSGDEVGHVPQWSCWSSQLSGFGSFLIGFLAKYSYGAYLYQFCAVKILNIVWGTRPDWLFFLTPLLAWVLAVPSELYLEKPIVDAVEHRLRKGGSAQRGVP